MKTLDQSPLQDSFVQNPYALYAQVLSRDPVRFWTDYDMPAVFSNAHVHALLRDRRLGRAAPQNQQATPPAHLRAFNALERVSMLDLEPPTHTRLRGLVLRAFTSRRIKALQPDILDISRQLIAEFPSGPFDLLPAYCNALPVRIIARLLGVPEEMSVQLLLWSNTMVAMYQAGRNLTTERAANAAAAEFTEFLSCYIDERRKQPRDDLITHLIAAEQDGDALSRDEMIGTCVLLLNAGHEATVHTLGNAVKALLENETPQTALSDANIAGTVEEVLRFDPPLHMFTRYAYEDFEIAGACIREGTQVALILGAAGRDPLLCNNPNDFDPFRAPVQHAAFGGGLHFCVGAPLARLELQLGLQQLFRLVPKLKLAGPRRYSNTYHFHGLESLIVETG